MLCAKRSYGLLFLLCLVPFLNLPANAQQEKPLPSLLTPESQKVLDKLASLSAFPGPSWQYHAGDLQHGESPSPDDAGWLAVTTPATLPAEAVWLRAAFEVP
jgi:alpha-mannosidase